jgi:hypothetical protein
MKRLRPLLLALVPKAKKRRLSLKLNSQSKRKLS